MKDNIFGEKDKMTTPYKDSLTIEERINDEYMRGNPEIARQLETTYYASKCKKVARESQATESRNQFRSLLTKFWNYEKSLPSVWNDE